MTNKVREGAVKGENRAIAQDGWSKVNAPTAANKPKVAPPPRPKPKA